MEKGATRSIKWGVWKDTENDFYGKFDPYLGELIVVTVESINMDRISHRSPFQYHFKLLIWLMGQSAIN